MLLARVIGNVVSSHKDENLIGKKLLIVKKLDLNGNLTGKEIVAVDSIGAGEGETVMIVKEGSVVKQIFETDKLPVHTVIVGIIDKIDFMEDRR